MEGREIERGGGAMGSITGVWVSCDGEEMEQAANTLLSGEGLSSALR